ncbi:hypothetical protein WMY93_010784 [Mugilogobius chulae]|uniref:Uncharacterized protein n=1 Tax=Mugilogobius chulae TaxID=88201 RepID=A0AAW0P8B0_9GOBI
MRATVQAPTAELTSPNRENRLKLMDATKLKKKRRLKELQEVVQQKEALEMKVEELQKELDTHGEENLKVQDLSQKFHKVQETNNKLLHINKVVKWKVKDLENVAQHEALKNKVEEKDLTEVSELSETKLAPEEAE